MRARRGATSSAACRPTGRACTGSRGYFHAQAAQTAARIGARFDWSLQVVPGVGHDPEGMSRAAARYLYGEPPDRP